MTHTERTVTPVTNLNEWADVVYLPRGSVAHVKPFTEQAAYPAALCGRTPDLFSAWLGTGTQTERDQAASLPLCKRCEVKSTRQAA